MQKKQTTWSIAVIIALLFSSLSGAIAQAQSDANSANQRLFIPQVQGPGVTETASMTDQIIVRFADEVQAAATDRVAQVAALSQAAGVDLAYVREMSGDSTVLKLPKRMSDAEVSAITSRLSGLGQIALAEPDRIMQTMATPTDPSFPQQWDFSAPVAGSYGANLPAAWNIITGSTSIVVAVIDTGITGHAEFTGRTVQGYDFINDSLVANDGNGRDNNPSDPGDWITSAESASGYFVGCTVSNSSWHGSHVAGTIGANANNGIGIAGIGWSTKILAARVLGKCGGYTSDIADAIRWSAGGTVTGVPANANPAKVLSLSLGGSGTCDTTTQNAINDAVGRGAVVVVAAGNSNANAANYSPSSCANVITVAATGPTGNRAYYSNYGATVEIAAPGGDKNVGPTVLSTVNTGTTTPVADGYATYQGTSMATPHVSGIVSLMFSVNPNLTPGQVLSIIQNPANVTPFPSGSTCNATTPCGPGIINAALVVAASSNPPPPPAPGAFNKTAPSNNATRQNINTVTLQWGVSSNASRYEYCIDTVNNSACDASWVSVGSATSNHPTGLLSARTYYWQVRAVNVTGTTNANGGTWWRFSTR